MAGSNHRSAAAYSRLALPLPALQILTALAYTSEQFACSSGHASVALTAVPHCSDNVFRAIAYDVPLSQAGRLPPSAPLLPVRHRP
jgi:hypothetical protein